MIRQPLVVKGEGRWDAANQRWRPSPQNACPSCGGLLSAAGAAERYVVGDGPGGVGATFGLHRHCLSCGATTTQIEGENGSLGLPMVEP